MQTLLLCEDFNQGQFVQQGFKYESLPSKVLLFTVCDTELFESLNSTDVVFVLIHQLKNLHTVLSRLHCFNTSLPIVVLSHCYDQILLDSIRYQKIRSFYTRPFHFRVIANEVRSMVYLRREQSTYQILKIRGLELNRNTHEVRWQNRAIPLRHKEFILLEFLMLNAGRLLSRETILESVWDRNANIFTNTVDVHINKLRKKIDYCVQEKFIHTVHCSGYIFS